MERTLRTKLASALILGLVFLAGSVVGVAVDRQMGGAPSTLDDASEVEEPTVAEEGREGERSGRRGERGESDGPRPPMYAQVDGLTEEQRARIDAIVDSSRVRQFQLRRAMDEETDPLEDSLRTLQRKWRDRSGAVVDSTFAAIKAVMTSEQAAQYDSIRAERERRDRERRRGRSPSGSSKD